MKPVHFNTKHGHRNMHGRNKPSGVYISWTRMMARCYSKNHDKYKYYGGRGITVCDSWHKFENFLADMGPRPRNKSLDRKDVNAGYSPENCKWSTHTEQMRNRRNTRFILYRGIRYTLSEILNKKNMSNGAFHYRESLGWSMDKIFDKPIRRYTAVR